VPLAAALHNRWPDAKIHWLVNAPYADVLSAHPAIDTVIPFDRKGMGATRKTLTPLPVIRFLRSLRKANYDITIDAQGLLRSGLFTWATRAKRRIGYADARELGWLGLNSRVRIPQDTHTVDRMMALLEPLQINDDKPDLRLYCAHDAVATVKADAEFGHPYVVLAPTSLWEAKRWPIERFAELAKRIAESGLHIVVIGAPGEEDQCSPLLKLAEAGLPVIDRVGKTSIGTMMAIIERSQAVVANDSAALHMAVGFDRPIVALFGPTRTQLVGPYKKDEAVIQHIEPGDPMDHKHAESGQAMMRRIAVDEVWDALNLSLEQFLSNCSERPCH